MLLLFSFPILTRASDNLSYEMQAALITKILLYNNNLDKTNKGDTIVVGLLYNEKSISALKNFANEFSKLKTKGVKVKDYKLDFCPVEMTTKDDLANDLKSKKVGVLYIMNAKDMDIAAITKVTQNAKVLSVLGDDVEKSLKKGATMGFASDNNRPSILVNVQSAFKEGCDFSAQFLSLVKIVK